MSDNKRLRIVTPRTGKSPLKGVNSPFLKSATSKNIKMEKAKNLNSLNKSNIEQQQLVNDAYASSKEKLLLSKIISLKKENNELRLIQKRTEEKLRKEISTTQSELRAIKSLLKKVLPSLNQNIKEDAKIQIENFIDKGSIFPKVADFSIQCAQSELESEKGNTNKESTQANSSGERFTFKGMQDVQETASNRKKSREDTLLNQNKETECFKNYMQYYFHDRGRGENIIQKPISPSFFKSLYIVPNSIQQI